VQIGDSFVRIDHRQRGTGCDGRFNVCLDLRLLLIRQVFDAGQQVAESVVRVDADFVERGGVLCEDIPKEDADGMTEDDRVRHFHHCRFEMHRQ
jgi:hypothetical protein